MCAWRVACIRKGGHTWRTRRAILWGSSSWDCRDFGCGGCGRNKLRKEKETRSGERKKRRKKVSCCCWLHSPCINLLAIIPCLQVCFQGLLAQVLQSSQVVHGSTHFWHDVKLRGLRFRVCVVHDHMHLCVRACGLSSKCCFYLFSENNSRTPLGLGLGSLGKERRREMTVRRRYSRLRS